MSLALALHRRANKALEDSKRARSPDERTQLMHLASRLKALAEQERDRELRAQNIAIEKERRR